MIVTLECALTVLILLSFQKLHEHVVISNSSREKRRSGNGADFEWVVNETL